MVQTSEATRSHTYLFGQELLNPLSLIVQIVIFAVVVVIVNNFLWTLFNGVVEMGAKVAQRKNAHVLPHDERRGSKRKQIEP